MDINQVREALKDFEWFKSERTSGQYKSWLALDSDSFIVYCVTEYSSGAATIEEMLDNEWLNLTINENGDLAYVDDEDEPC